MAQTQLFIPDKINVGFQERSGTYTGKLAYVIYWDKKGVLRKEKSWNSWRDQKINSQEFTNEPTEGFVLNKKVGGYKSDWNFRQSYVRVYDPRDFEFEITVENLLFILENCSAIKGKGLEGQFVYSWSGTDLVLLPVDCENYKKSATFTDLQAKKLSKKDLVAGNVYRDKNQRELLYIGRHNKFLDKKGYNNPVQKISKEHVFRQLKDGVYSKPEVPETSYWYDRPDIFGGFEFGTAVNELVSEKHPQTAEATQDYWESPCGSQIVDVITKNVKPQLSKSHYNSNERKTYKTHWVFDEGVYKPISYQPDHDYLGDGKYHCKGHHYSLHDSYLIEPPNIKRLETKFTSYDLANKKEIKDWYSSKTYYYISHDHFDHYQPLEVCLKLESGSLVKLENYVGLEYTFSERY